MDEAPAAREAPHHPADPVTITPCPDGPLIVRGDFVLRTPEGAHIDPGRATVALCRCGLSGSRPFCDGSHKVAGWRSGP